jgi:hypothetical protein
MLEHLHSENRVLRRIFGPERDEIVGGLRKLCGEELHNVYPLPNVIRMNKSRRMMWAVHVPHMRQKRHAYRVLVGKPEGERLLGRLDIDGVVILKWDIERYDGGVWSVLIWFRMETVVGPC